MDRYKGTDVAAYLLKRYSFQFSGLAPLQRIEDLVWEMGREALNSVRVTLATAERLTEDAQYVRLSVEGERHAVYEPIERGGLDVLTREANRRERELRTLLEALKGLSDEADSLNRETAAAMLAATEARDAHRAVNALYEQAARTVENLSADRERLAAELNALTDVVRERDLLRRQLAEAHEVVEVFRMDHAAFRKEAAEDQQELADAHTTATGLRAELQEARRELEVLRNDNERLREERGTFEQEAHDLRQERDELIDARDVAQEALRDALDRAQEQQNRADDAEEALAREEAMNRR